MPADRTIRWHGRGGQGSFTAARLLGHAAALHAGRHALAIPSFGPERRGAPVVCATRLGDRPIRERGPAPVCDVAVVLDRTMAATAASGLVAGGVLLVNAASTIPGALVINADALARTHLGRPIPGPPLLGALAALDVVPLAALLAAAGEVWTGRLADANRAAISAGYTAARSARVEPVTDADDDSSITVAVRPVTGHRPALRAWQVPASLADLPVGPVLPAGHLVTGFASWRSERPVVDSDACVACGHCWLACPDGALLPAGTAIAIDGELCKGCGICAAACQVEAIRMRPEAAHA